MISKDGVPKESLCRLLLWHDTYDQYSYNPSIAVAHADWAVSGYMSQGWSWYMPSEIIKWHPYWVPPSSVIQ